MAPPRESARRTAGTFGDRITGPALVSWPVLVVVSTWSSMLALLGGGSSVSGSPLIRAVLGALAGVAAFLSVAVIWKVVIRRCRGLLRLGVAVVTVILGGVVRAVVMQLGLTSFDYVDSTAVTLATRVANGIATIPIAFVIGSAAVSALRSYRETATALIAEQARLVGLLQESSREIEERQVDAITRVRKRLDDEIEAVPWESASSALQALHSLAGDVVRPLSHSLARDLPDWTVDVVEEVPRVRWIDVWRTPEPQVAVRPLLLPAACLVLAVPASFLLLTPRYGVVAALASVSVLSLVLFAGRPAVRRLSPLRPVRVWSAIVALLLLGAGAVALTVIALAGADPSVAVFLGPGVFAVIVFGLLIATASMMQVRMRQSTSQLEAVTRDLRWTLARVNAQQWEQQGRLSRALHGSVQALVHAQIRRLHDELHGGAVTSADLEALRAELQGALARALSLPDSRADVSEVLGEVAVTWRGVAEITYDVSRDASARLRRDPLCSRVVSDLASEAVSNAARHGHARRVDILIDMDSPDLVLLRVEDDGAGVPPSSPGLGTAWLSRCSYDWSLSTSRPTTLVALLPCAGS